MRPLSRFFQVVLLCLAIFAGNQGWVSVTQAVQFGINIGTSNLSERGGTFVDIVKEVYRWQSIGGSDHSSAPISTPSPKGRSSPSISVVTRASTPLSIAALSLLI